MIHEQCQKEAKGFVNHEEEGLLLWFSRVWILYWDIAFDDLWGRNGLLVHRNSFRIEDIWLISLYFYYKGKKDSYIHLVNSIDWSFHMVHIILNKDDWIPVVFWSFQQLSWLHCYFVRNMDYLWCVVRDIHVVFMFFSLPFNVYIQFIHFICCYIITK